MISPIYCEACGCAILPVAKDQALPLECPFCHTPISKGESQPIYNLPKKIGNYSIIKSLGKGGMGEVFLAYDPICQREIALKKIRSDLAGHKIIRSRFLREALITSKLAHPAIVPIYSIHQLKSSLYYIMPFLEGKTLKQMIQEAQAKDKDSESSETSSYGEGSIPSFLRIFIKISQAVAYAHSKGYLHRDLKPENMIVGKYGQVFILDWGLVQSINGKSIDVDHEISTDHDKSDNSLTRPGKIVGTLAYMAPERALGSSSSIQTDIYSLGVMLYQLLTLKLPFRRKNLSEFLKNIKKEELLNPAVVAPERDIPSELSHIVSKALSYNPESRYTTVDDLINDLENHLEGRSSWFPMATLDIHQKKDWEFQENLFIPEHSAITRSAEVTEWVTLMISKLSFSGNTQITAKIRIAEAGQGIGLLMNIPEALDRISPTDGYCLWLSSEEGKPSKLYKSTIEVMNIPDVVLRKEKWQTLKLERQDNNLHFYLNDHYKFSYISHLPLAGTHIGILYRDTHFEISPLSISAGSQNLQVSCLAVPNAFLAHRDYNKALSEYRRIGYSFPGRAEGRQALFKAGITLIEQGKIQKNPKKAEKYYLEALEEFEKLHHTPGAPLEYLGKALVYEALNENEEEVKCLELACRRYRKSHLRNIVEAQILYRMHQSSQTDRISAYRFILLATQHLKHSLLNSENQKIFRRLMHHWEPLPFIIDILKEPTHPEKLINFSIQLSFWLAKDQTLAEILDGLKSKDSNPILIGNALFALLELGAISQVQTQLALYKELDLHPLICAEVQLALNCHEFQIEQTIKTIFSQMELLKKSPKALFHILDFLLSTRQEHSVEQICSQLPLEFFSDEDQLRFKTRHVWALLFERKWEEAGAIFQQYPLTFINHDFTSLHFLYGCWLYVMEGKEISDIHFSGILDTIFPRTWTLAAHYLSGSHYQKWHSQAFWWEKHQLYRQLALYYYCSNEVENAQFFQDLVSAYCRKI